MELLKRKGMRYIDKVNVVTDGKCSKYYDLKVFPLQSKSALIIVPIHWVLVELG